MEKKKRVTFGKARVQKLNRVALPSYLLENLGIEVGNNIELFLDIKKKEIIIKKLKNG